jgi:hypothetical protein
MASSLIATRGVHRAVAVLDIMAGTGRAAGRGVRVAARGARLPAVVAVVVVVVVAVLAACLAVVAAVAMTRTAPMAAWLAVMVILTAR